MTQERKDELYDQMIAWICEHMLLANTKYFFNVVDEFIICKYRYRVKE